jgi:hypothetical protein
MGRLEGDRLFISERAMVFGSEFEQHLSASKRVDN